MLAIAVAALAAVIPAGAGVVASLRGVGDARAEVITILAAHREPVNGLPAPPKLAAAIVCVEDEHFYDNFLINVLTGVGRAVLATVDNGPDPGGSTIDQQLAKLLYGGGGGLSGTLREVGLGIKLALSYSHREILQMNLNAAYYGQGYWGVTSAARGYFGTAPARLTWPEAAMLAGLVQAPTAYDPVRHFALAKARQRHVIDQLVVNGYLTTRQARAADTAVLPLRR